ncbi:hypothetical protein GCM10027569_46240 [Flindersiella endophytica]
MIQRIPPRHGTSGRQVPTLPARRTAVIQGRFRIAAATRSPPEHAPGSKQVESPGVGGVRGVGGRAAEIGHPTPGRRYLRIGGGEDCRLPCNPDSQSASATRPTPPTG